MGRTAIPQAAPRKRKNPSSRKTKDSASKTLRIRFFSKGGLSPGSGILVQESLCNSLVNLLDRHTDSFLTILGTGFNSRVGLFDLRFQSRALRLIPFGFTAIDLHTSFGGI